MSDNNKYILQLRRGWKIADASGRVIRDDWAEAEARWKDGEQGATSENIGKYKDPDYVRPQEGELVIEYLNGIPRLKIGNGINEFSQLPYLSVDSFVMPKPATVRLDSGDWYELSEAGKISRYYQVVYQKYNGEVQIDKFTNATITQNSKVDLLPTQEQLALFYRKDLAFTTETEYVVDDENNVMLTVKVYSMVNHPQAKETYEIPVTITEVLE